MPIDIHAVSALRAPFGALSDGSAVEAVTLSNHAGMSARIMTLGATLQSLIVPDRGGRQADVVLGYDTAQDYLDHPAYFGVTVGRHANRIANARFALDGQTCMLTSNDGQNSLHGGARGFDKRLWKIESVSSGREAKAVLSYISADGEEGYPGELKVTATYSLNGHNELGLEYRATTSKPTVVNIINHSFFNLAGHEARDVMGHLLTLHAAQFVPVDAVLIPLGGCRAVDGTPFDFRTARPIGERIRDARDEQIRFVQGYGHTFVIDGAAGTLRPGAVLEDPVSGRKLEIGITAPGIQVYSGNYLNGRLFGKDQRAYRQGDGIALEPGAFPDSPNRPDFPSTRLDPGQTYVNAAVYKFSASAGR